MTRKKPTDMGHSVFQRLLNLARERKEDFNLLLQRCGIERLLYRISISPQAERFILKGASMFLVWNGFSPRVTRDADLLSIGSSDPGHLETVFRELLQISTEELDGMVFDPETVRSRKTVGSGSLYRAISITPVFRSRLTSDSATRSLLHRNGSSFRA